MARRKLDPITRDSQEDTEELGGDTNGAPEPETRSRRRKETPLGRITLTMELDTITKLRFASISERVQPCEFVERLLKPVVRPYVLSIRDRRTAPEPGEAA